MLLQKWLVNLSLFCSEAWSNTHNGIIDINSVFLGGGRQHVPFSGSFIKTSSNLHPFKRWELPENKGYINEGNITH